MRKAIGKSLKLGYYGVLGYCTYLMLLITAQYTAFDLDGAFLRVKQDALTHFYYAPAFFSHVFTSIVVLLLGAGQFSEWMRKRWPQLHRRLGYGYVVLILTIASPSGLIMALHANGGWTAQLSFVLQALLWWVWTYQALQKARQLDWEAHAYFMALSYALTLSAITLRLWKWAIVTLLAPPPMDTYRVVAWLGWVGNVCLVELYYRHTKNVGSAP
jgi:uncharacterized membrane protein